MDPLDSNFSGLPLDGAEQGDENQPFGGDQPGKILLAEVPAPRVSTRFAPEPDVESAMPFSVPSSEIEVTPPRRSRLAPIKAQVKQGYFDPAKAFEAGVDWSKFRKAQIFLFLLSISMPFFTLLFLGVLLGVVYLTGASLYSAGTPNPIHELMLYPLVFVLARGYWIAYLILPMGLYTIGWLWAAATAWAISKGEHEDRIDFNKALAILAMLGAMLAPFTLFPFLRLLAMVVILWFLAKRMEDTFDISFWPLVSRGGVILVGAIFLYGAIERKVESYFPATEELRANLDGFMRHKKRLEWPSFRAKIHIDPNERLFADLSNFGPQTREQAVQKCLAILRDGSDTSEFRFRLAKRMADDGQTEAYLFAARYSATGQGTTVNYSAAMDWMNKYLNANPNHVEAGLEKAKWLIINDKKLESKRWLVQMSKNRIKDISKITTFIQKENLGQIDSNLTYEIQNLYQADNFASNSGSYTNSYYSGSRSGYEVQTRQDYLMRRLYVNEHDKSLWFYRAMVAEYSRSDVAGPEVYGEVSTDYQASDLDQKIKAGDPVALDIAADRSASKGDHATARQYWIAATQLLNHDDRRANVPYYLKLAESYDPKTGNAYPDPSEATKYYLATLLISTWGGRMTPIGQGPLQRLLEGKTPDPMDQPFLDLCLKYNIPEAWVMMGDRHLNGDFPGIPKNLVKAKDCFVKARSLGYKGPQFFKQLALLESENTVPGNSRSGRP